MGPNTDALEAIKHDAVKTTLRHFRDSAEDNGFVPLVDLDDVHAEQTRAEGEPAKVTAKSKARAKKADAEEGQLVDEAPKEGE